jgi:DNA-binding response OmpR family regulator
LYASWLLDAGYEVEEASDGHAALEKAMEPGVDMLVLDVMMPGMDGIEVIKRLRAAKSDIYIVAVSGGAPGIPADVALMMAGMFGVDRMLYKPFNHHTLLAVLAEAEAGVPQAAE